MRAKGGTENAAELRVKEANMPQDIESRLQERNDRVRDHSAAIVNQRIERITQSNIDRSIAKGRDAIVRRLAQLDMEWDIDRALMLNFSLAGGAAFAIGLTRYVNTPRPYPRRKGFLYLLGAQLGFLFVHATVGWCPPMAVLRRLGFRTRTEIDVERSALLEALEPRTTLS
jgi:hypothetical protein